MYTAYLNPKSIFLFFLLKDVKCLQNHQPGRNIHRHQLLEQQFRSIRQPHLRNLRLILTPLTLKRVIPHIRNRNQPTEITNMNPVRIGHLEQALPQKLRRPMRYLTIALHLPKTQSTIPGTPLHRLSHQNLQGATRPRMDLIVHHVLQALIVRGAQEDLRVNFPPCMPIVHDLVPSQVVPILLQEGGDLLHVHSVIERGGITNFPLVGRDFALNALDQVTDCHTGWNSVGVDDDVRGQPLAREWHVLLAVLYPAGT